MRLEGRTAIITGAGSGFGAAMATEFAKEGARVVVNDLNDNTSANRSSMTFGQGRRRGHVPQGRRCGQGDEVKAMIDAVVDAYGGFSVLINNAGVPQWNQPLTETDEATFDRIFEVNVKSIYHTSDPRHSGDAERRRRRDHPYGVDRGDPAAGRPRLGTTPARAPWRT